MSVTSVYIGAEVDADDVSDAVLEWPDLRGPRSYFLEPVDEYDGQYKTVIDLAGDDAQVASLLAFLRGRFPGVSIELEEVLDRAEVAAMNASGTK